MVKKKLNLHQNKGKLQNIPKPIPVPIPSTSSASTQTAATTTTVLDEDPNSEMAQKFEVELCWCIQQVQNSLKSGKLNPKQVVESTKILNTLMSNSAAIIKKRQVMRMAFGDYRAKMEAEEKKYQAQSNANRIKVKPATPSKKSVFIKKSLFATASGKEFRFNFPLPDVSSIKIIEDIKINSNTNPTTTVNVPSTDDTTKAKAFKSSDNSFKFNFPLKNDDQ